MAPLRHALARNIRLRKRIALQHGDDGVEIRQRARRQQTAHAGADHNGMLTNMFHRNAPARFACQRRVFAVRGRRSDGFGRRAHKFVKHGLKPLRPSSVSTRVRALTSRFFPAKGGDHGSQISDLHDPARRAGRNRAAGATDQYRACHPSAARRHRARLRAGHAGRGTAARFGAAHGAAAADLFGQRRHELARVQIQPPSDHPAIGRLRDLHGIHGRRRDALPDRTALGRRLPAGGDRRPAGRGGAAGDCPETGHVRAVSSWCSKAKGLPTTPRR